MSYEIKFGDTLGALARRFGTTVQRLAKANGIRDVNRIFAGRTLRLPGDSRSTQGATRRLGGYTPATRPLSGGSGARSHSEPASSGGFSLKGATDAAKRFVQQAMRFIGQPYRWGGGHGAQMRGPAPVDCSGLVQQASGLAGVGRSGTAATFQRMGKSVSMSALRPGDLVFRGSPANHVGIYVGNGKVLHAPTTGKRVSFTNASYFESARRLF